MSTTTGLHYREGTPGDLRATFDLSETAPVEEWGGEPADPQEADLRWQQERALMEFASAQPETRWWICEDDAGELVGYARVGHYGAMDELAELCVATPRRGVGAGRGLLERCWPGPPTPSLGRVALTRGLAPDLTLYTNFGVMPVTGHWRLRLRAEEYVERRLKETMDGTEAGAHLLNPERAVEEWQRLEPAAIGYDRPQLHEFFGRTRVCLAVLDPGERVVGLCWVSPHGDIGPAVGASPEDVIPVVLAALDRVAKAREPEWVGVSCTTDSWWLLRRLRRLGFHVEAPSWVMSSVPLPGLDRYVPSRPARLL